MKLATIEIISAIRPHANADRLEIATVLGWQTIIAKGSFKEGDRAVMVVIDTILPAAPWSAFLADKKDPAKPIRLRTIKLRGEYSQGLLLPLDVLPEHVRDWQIGADVGAELGIKKYEKEIPAALSGICKSTFPVHLACKTDEDNGLSNPDIVAFVLGHDTLVVTKKLDGSSGTIIWEEGKGITEVCSRNMSLVESEGNAFWQAARKLKLDDFQDIANPGDRVVIQGELMGPGIQGNQLGLNKPELFIYQIKHSVDGYADDEELRASGSLLEAKVVPLVAVLDQREGRVTLAKLQEMADAQTLPDGSPAEGIVIRPHPTVAFSNGRPAGFKIINRNYGE